MMVAHGAMASAREHNDTLQHFVPVGSVVCCVDPYGNKTEGELVAMDEPTGMIVIRGPTGADNKADLTVLNRHFLADFDIKTKQTQPIRGLVMPERPINEQAIRKAVDEKVEAIMRVGPPHVSDAGKELFKVINKTYSNLEWDEDVILGLDGDFSVRPPYMPDDVRGNDISVQRIRKVVEKFHADSIKK